MDQPLRDESSSVYRAICPVAGTSRSRSSASVSSLARAYRSSDARATERRDGHEPVVIAEADGDERSPAFTDLYRIAADNAAIARRCSRSTDPARRLTVVDASERC